MKNLQAKNLLAALISAAALSACGGGGDSGIASNGTTTTTANFTGKAIDGYLVGATVCLDLNNNNICDAGEPSATTDANGSYGLIYAHDPAGKKLLVVVTPATKDNSRPGYTFPTSFTLSAVADGSSGQNVTPLTTMVQSLIDSGQTRSAAEKAVASLVGGSVDLKADYVANGDSSTATFAGKIVDKVTQFAGSENNADGVRAVMNAIVSKGDVDAVTQTDVDAAAKLPTYDANIQASDLLNKTFYGYDQTEHPESASAAMSAVRWALGNTALRDDVLSFDVATLLPTPVDSWERERFDGLHSLLATTNNQLVLQPDGSWAPFSWLNTDGSYKSIQVQGVSGNTVTVANPKTSKADTITNRSVQLGGVSFADATIGMLDAYTRAKLTGSFSGDVPAYLGVLTTGADMLSLDAGTGCESSSYSCIDSSAQVHTSVEDVLGMAIPLPSSLVGTTTYLPNTKLILAADGTGQIVDQGNSQVVYDSTKVSWTKYAGNSNVIVVSITLDGNSTYALRAQDFLQAGGKLVLALQDGHLKLGQLLPAGTEFRFMEFSQTALNQLVAAIRQALSL